VRALGDTREFEQQREKTPLEDKYLCNCAEIPTILTWIALPGKIHLVSSFEFIRNICDFESSTKFRFSTSYDFKKAKLPRHCPGETFVKDYAT